MRKLAFALLASTALIAPENADAAPVVVWGFAQAGMLGAASIAGNVLVSAAINIAASSVLAYASTAMAKANQKPIRNPGIRTEHATSGETTPRTIIFGRYATAGNFVCPPRVHGISGTKARGRNRYLTYMLDLGDLPIDGLDGVVVNGEHTTDFSGGAETGDLAYMGDKATGDLAGNCWLSSFSDGRHTVADPWMMSVYGNPLDPPPDHIWQDDMILTGVPYVVLNFRANQKLYSGFPNVRVIARGMRLYDPRLDTTVGGSGAHRLNDDSTWAFTENPVVMAYNLFLGLDMLDGTTFGVGVAQSSLPLSVWSAAMNACDEQVSLSGGGTEDRYRAGLEFSTDEEPFSVIEELMTACGGKLAEVGGYWHIAVGAPDTATLSITDDDILISSPEDFDPFPAQGEIFNGVHATFPDAGQEWSAREAVPLYDASFEAEDGERNVAQLNLSAVPWSTQVRRLMRENLKDGRRLRTHTITLPPEAAGVPTLLTIAWTSGHNFYTNKLFEVVGKTIDPTTLFVTLTLRERDPSDYDEDAASDAFRPEIVTPVVPPIIYDGLDGWSVTGTSIPGTSGSNARPAILLEWDVGGTENGRIEWQVREQSTTNKVATGFADYQQGDEGIYVAGQIAGATTYEARARHIDSKTDNLWTAWEPATTPDLKFTESDLEQALQDKIDGAVQDAADAASDAADALAAVAGIDQQLIDDLEALLADFGNIDPNDVLDARNIAISSLGDGWVTDPTFQDWTSGNLTAANWVNRTGVSTYGTKDTANGLYKSSIYIDVPTGSGAVTLVPVLVGPDAQAEYLIASILVDYLAGDPDGARFRVEWSNDAFSTSTRGDMLGLTAPQGTFTQHGIAVDPGVLKGKQVLVKRPSGTFNAVRLWLQPKLGTNTTAQEMRIHKIELRAATESEIEAGLAGPNLSAAVTQLETEIEGVDTAVAALDTQVNARIDDAEADISTEQAARVSGDNANAAAITALTATVGDNTADITTVSQAITDLDTATVGQFNSVNARVDNAEGAITSEAAARASADEALSGRVTTVEASLTSGQTLNHRVDFEDGETGGWGGTVINVTSAGAWTKALQVTAFNAEGPWRSGDKRGRTIKVRGRAQLQNSTADMNVGIAFDGASNKLERALDAGSGWADFEVIVTTPTSAAYESTGWKPLIFPVGDTTTSDIRVAWIEFDDITDAADAKATAETAVAASVTNSQSIASLQTTLTATQNGLSATQQTVQTVVASQDLLASTYVLRQKAGAATGTVEAVAYDNPEGSASAITFTYDLIDLQGQVRASDLLVTSQGNNLVPDATLSDPDSWFLPTGWSIKSAPSYVGFARELCYDGPLNQGITSSNTVATFDVHPGREYHAKVQVRSNGAVAHRSQMQVRWFKSDGSPSDFNNDFSGWITETSGSTWIKMDVTAPSDAVAGKLISRVDTNNTGGEVRWSGFDCKEKAGAGELVVDHSIYAQHLTVSEAVITESLQIADLIIQRGSVQDAQIIGGRSHSAADLTVDMDTSNTDWQFARGYTFTAMTGVGQHGIIGGCRVYVHNFASAAVGVGQIRFRIHVDGSYRAQAPFNVQFTNSTDEVITFPMIPVEVGNGQTIQLRLEYRITNQANNTDGDFDNIDFFAQEHSGK